MPTRFLFILGCFFCACFICAAEKDDKTLDRSSDFMRVSYRNPETKKGVLSFDTAIATFRDQKKEIEVDLIAAVHVGDEIYYQNLNTIFKKYDAVLYELVAEKETRPSKKDTSQKNEKPLSLLGNFQSGMGKSLGLEFQLEHIDYKSPNFVHADLSPQEFASRVADRGDIVQMLYRIFTLGVKKSGTEGQQDELQLQGRMLGALLASNSSLSLKRLFAKEMISQMDDAMWVIGGDDGSAIITDRNNAALKVLRQEIKNGKKKIAIFYGGAHLPEFAKSLEKEFAMKLTNVSWIIAWDMTSDQSARKAAP
ncbi:MAG: hypothetical protein ACRCUY_11500 [Thermoguttaceae bacterium]